MNWKAILDRLKQPSSFAGYALIIVTVMGLIGRPLDVDPTALAQMSADVFIPIGKCLTAVFALIAVFKTEKPAE